MLYSNLNTRNDQDRSCDRQEGFVIRLKSDVETPRSWPAWRRPVTAKILPVSYLFRGLNAPSSRNLKRIFDSSRGSIVPIIRQANGTWNDRDLTSNSEAPSTLPLFAHFVCCSPPMIETRRGKTGVQLKSSTLFIARNYCVTGNIDN